MKYSFPPLLGENPKILILGSLPGKRSLDAYEYYAHEQNHFWPILFEIFEHAPTDHYATRCKLLLDNHIALWDIAHHAEREGSLDSKIQNLVPNDVPALLRTQQSIHMLLFNGGFSYKNYKKFFGEPTIHHEIMLSTSPTCAGRDAERREMWQNVIKKGLAL